MVRCKASCSRCGNKISLLITDSEDVEALHTLESGEFFEHKCPHCGEWGAFEIL